MPVCQRETTHAADPAAGKTVFSSLCSICHSAQPGKNGVGPTDKIRVFGSWQYDYEKGHGANFAGGLGPLTLTLPNAGIHRCRHRYADDLCDVLQQSEASCTATGLTVHELDISVGAEGGPMPYSTTRCAVLLWLRRVRRVGPLAE